MKLITVHRKYLGKKSVNCELFAKIFADIHRYIENVFGICTDCSLFAKFFLTNSFYLYGSPCQVFPVYSISSGEQCVVLCHSVCLSVY